MKLPRLFTSRKTRTSTQPTKPADTTNIPEAIKLNDDLENGVLIEAPSFTENKEKQVEIPSWFLNNCVKTSEELKDRTIPIIVLEAAPAGGIDPSLAAKESNAIAGAFEIESVVYEALYVVLSSPLPERDCLGGGQLGKSFNPVQFKKNAALLRIPNQCTGRGGPSFLQGIVEYFAREIEADLITLSLEDLKDLGQHIAIAEGIFMPEGAVEYMSMYCGQQEGDNSGFAPKAVQFPKSNHKIESPLATVLRSAQLKAASRNSSKSELVSAPLIVHIPEVHELPYSTLKALCDAAANEEGRLSNVLLISSTTTSSCQEDDNILRLTGTKPVKRAIRVVPVRCRAQMHLLEVGPKGSDIFLQSNVRALQRRIRQDLKDIWTPMVEPYTTWDFLEGYTPSTRLARRHLGEEEVECLAEQINGSLDPEHIRAVILGAERRDEVLLDWGEKMSLGKWANFPSNVQAAIRKIEYNEGDLTWEKKFLDLIVNPDTVEEGWSDIELELEVKDAIVQMIDQPGNKGQAAYGILRRGRVGGALIYGPPGTGKTHLARVLAKECQAVMISASVADIEDMHVGETEKAIKGLFNLGRLLAPSIIFIDEADALFRARAPGDHTWERSRTNQLLTEMDGLVKVKSPPFVLIATNYPRQLDHAVLRRTPCRLHIGLPPAVARQRIFRMNLREERVDQNIDWGNLARITPGFSGSDIRTMCLQAALISEASGLRKDGRRVLSKAHFEKAFQRSAPTVSKAALAHIREFAKEHDPAAWAKMRSSERNQEDKLENLEAGHSVGSSNAEPTPSNLSEPVSEGLGQAVQQPTSPASIRREPPKSTSGGGTETIQANFNEQGSASDSATHNVAFAYTPLKAKSKQIRVLSIEPAMESDDPARQDPIRCRLENVDLDDCTPLYSHHVAKHKEELGLLPQGKLAAWHLTNLKLHAQLEDIRTTAPDSRKIRSYDTFSQVKDSYDVPLEEINPLVARFTWGDYIALSYVWGDPSNKEHIIINDCKFAVTRNLFVALHKLRESLEVRQLELKIWIDAICINQNDLMERETEVSKMGLIYSEALAVRAWLGLPQLTTPSEFTKAKDWLNSVRGLGVRQIKASLVPDAEAAHALRSLASSSAYAQYWTRLWVVQEMWLASSLLFWYGDWYFTPEDLCKLYYLFREGGVSTSYPFPLASNLPDSELLDYLCRPLARVNWLREWDNAFERGQLPIFDIVHLAQSSESTDPRDKVYGLLALMPEEIARSIRPSYAPDFSIRDACVAFSKACFQETGDLYDLARIRVSPIRRTDFPTWAFDLSTGSIDMSLGVRHKPHRANAHLHGAPMFSDDSLIMFCEGVFVDTVESLAAPSFRGDGTERDPEPGPVSADTGPYLLPVDDSSKLALARVLCHDSDYDFSQGPSLLDVPWIPKEEVVLNEPSGIISGCTKQDFYEVDEGRYWPIFAASTILGVIFTMAFYINADFMIHGVPLRHYFTSTEASCPNPAAYLKLQKPAAVFLREERLCVTRHGLVGMVPNSAKLGDRIAVLLQCDMPVVLRPKGEYYEYIGACFVEGLMKGEAIARMEKGELQRERIALC